MPGCQAGVWGVSLSSGFVPPFYVCSRSSDILVAVPELLGTLRTAAATLRLPPS